MVHKLIVIVLFASLGIVDGCGNGQLPVAPAKGKVLYHGKPLEFGSVMFQPDAGPASRGIIQPDGTFQLSTYGANDGAVIGSQRVRIACFETQRPSSSGPVGGRDSLGVGESLIPAKYSNFDSSSLRVEVKASNDPFVFELAD